MPFDIFFPVETICVKCQILFSKKNKKNVINLSSAELSQIVVKVNLFALYGLFLQSQIVAVTHTFFLP